MSDMQRNPEEGNSHLPPEGGYKWSKKNCPPNFDSQDNPHPPRQENANSEYANQNYGRGSQNPYPNQSQFNQPNPWNQPNGYNQYGYGSPYQNNGPSYPYNGYNGNGQMPTKPDSYLVWSILVTLLCCMVFGILAIIESSKVDSLWNQGRVDEAYRASDKAKQWCIWGAVAALIISVIYGIISLFTLVI